MNWSSAIIPPSALGNGDAHAGFKEQLENESARFEPATPSSVSAQTQRHTINESQWATGNAPDALHVHEEAGGANVPVKAPNIILSSPDQSTTESTKSDTEQSAAAQLLAGVTQPEQAAVINPAVLAATGVADNLAPAVKMPSEKTTAAAASPKTNDKSESTPKSAQRTELPADANRNVIAVVANPVQLPSPLSFVIHFPGWHDDLSDKAGETNASSGSPQSSASGLQSSGTGAGLAAAPGSDGSPSPANETKAAQGTRAGGTAPSGSNDELAFAAKVQPASEANQSSADSSRRSLSEAPVSAQSAGKKTVETESPDANASAEPPSAGTNLPMSNAIATFQQQDSQGSLPKPDANAAMTQSAEVPQTRHEQLPTSATPLKEVSFHIEQAQGQKVEVRLVEQGGEVRIAVRAGDSDLVQGLRQNLSEMTDRLAESGYHTETWHAAASEVSAAPPDNKDSSGRFGGDAQQQQPSGSQQERGQRDPNQSNRPRWVQEFETTLTGQTAPTGHFDGFNR